jgi:hypothetical protein
MPGARGEATIQAGEREVTILFTNRALAEAEGQIGKSIIGVAQGFAEGTTGIRDIAYLLQAGMEAARRDARAGGKVVTLNDAYQVLDAVGFTAVSVAVMEAVSAVLSFTGGDEVPNAGTGSG